MRPIKRNALCVALCLSIGFTALAQDAVPRSQRSILQPEEEAAALPAKFDESKYLTDNWGGYREHLRNAGVEVFGFYNNIISGNAAGGRDEGHATYDHDIWIGAKFDLEKLAGWKGGQFVISGINREGEDLTTKYIGSIFSTQQLVGGQRTFLYQVFLQQKFMGDKFTLKIGRFGASDDFNTSPLYGYSLNNGIDGDIRNVLFDTRFSAYPFATWAGAIFYDPTPEFHLKFGAFQVTKRMFENDDHGVNWSIGSTDGYTAIAELGWTPEFFKKPINATEQDGKRTVSIASKGLPGHYSLGFTYSQWDFYPRFLGGFEDHSYGFYAHADQMIYQEEPGSDHGLVVFVASGYYPQTEISIVPFQVNVGLNYKGLIPRRDDDRTVLHFIYGDISDDYARSVRVPGGDKAESEKVLEFAHRFQLTPWSYIQPDIQYVIDPGGTGDIPDAVVIGAQMGVVF